MSVLRKLLFLSLLLLGYLPLRGQYAGGTDDGHSLSVATVQLATFDQAGIYSGGAADGHDLATATVQLFTFDQFAIYGGGSADGHDLATATVQLATFDQFAIYGGGSDDGHDLATATVQLATFEQFAIYGGGSADGHDMITATNATALPLTLISFEALPERGFVLLKWSTENERSTDFFTVERTTDSRNFTAVGTAPAAGNSAVGEQLRYTMTDTDPQDGTSYYRLRTTDLDGSFRLSRLERVDYGPEASGWDYLVFPNPNDGHRLHLRTSGVSSRTLAVTLTDAGGRTVLQRLLTDTEEVALHTLELRRRLPAGSYVLRVRADNDDARSKLIVVQ